MQIISILAPVLLLVAMGYFLQKTAFLDKQFFRNCTRLTYWIGLPSLLFVKISNASVSFTETFKISLVMMGAVTIICVAALIIGRLIIHSRSKRKTYVITSFYSNTAYVGLPVIVYALSSIPSSTGLIDAASVAIAPVIPFVNFLSTLVMGSGDHRLSWQKAAGTAKKLLVNPLIIACLAGILITLMDVTMPQFINRGFSSLGNMALPLALLSIGAGLSFTDARGSVIPMVIAAVTNICLLPLLGLAGSHLLELSSSHTLIVMIYLACPTAATTFIFASEMGGDQKFAGNVIVLSTILSAVSLGTVIAMFL